LRGSPQCPSWVQGSDMKTAPGNTGPCTKACHPDIPQAMFDYDTLKNVD